MMGVGDPVRMVLSPASRIRETTSRGCPIFSRSLREKDWSCSEKSDQSSCTSRFWRTVPIRYGGLLKDAEEAAEKFRIQIGPAVIGKVEEIETSFSTMKRERRNSDRSATVY